MVNLKETTELIANNFNKWIFYDPKKERFNVVDDDTLFNSSKHLNDDEILDYIRNKYGISMFIYKYRDLIEYAKNFVNEHNDLFVNFKTDKIVYSKFLNYVKKNDVYNLWIEYFSNILSCNFYYWCFENNLKESEAYEWQYKEIRKLLEELNACGYEKKLSSDILFSIRDDYDNFGFMVMGNSGVAKGICIALNGLDKEYFYGVLATDQLHIDPITFNSLLNIVNFFYDGRDKNFKLNFNVDNPYGNDDFVSSTLMMQGNMIYSKLSASLANLCIGYIKKIKMYLSAFVSSNNFSKIDNNNIFVVTCENKKNKPSFSIEKISSFSFDRFPFDIGQDHFENYHNVKVISGECDFSFRAIDNYVRDGDSRESYFAYIMMITDHQIGKIIDFALIRPNLYKPLSSFSQNLKSMNKKIQVMKTIYVNNPYDIQFVHAIFEDKIKNKQIEIKYVNEKLKVDKAINYLKKELLKSDNIAKA